MEMGEHPGLNTEIAWIYTCSSPQIMVEVLTPIMYGAANIHYIPIFGGWTLNVGWLAPHLMFIPY